MAGHVLSRIELPSAWTAATLTLQVSTDGVTYRDLWDESGEVTYQAGANRAIHLSSFGWWTIRYLKIRSGTSAAPVNQGADRTIALYSGYKAS
ncbi:hypothetical protein CWO91_13890 [Bradyrhizobium genosp. SA-3]|nr:hypothetical protein CWO91_13890 [Bradyrhizobium genosp. SA-3]